MRYKSCGNGSKNCIAFRNVMRNGIAIGNPNLGVPVFNFANNRLKARGLFSIAREAPGTPALEEVLKGV